MTPTAAAPGVGTGSEGVRSMWEVFADGHRAGRVPAVHLRATSARRSQPAAPRRIPRYQVAVRGVLVFIFMGYFLHPRFPSAAAADAPATAVGEDRDTLMHGGDDLPARQAAAQRLVAARAERELTSCLAVEDALVVQLAAGGLWEIWMNEAGPAARKRLDAGNEALGRGDIRRGRGSLRKAHPRLPRVAGGPQQAGHGALPPRSSSREHPSLRGGFAPEARSLRRLERANLVRRPGRGLGPGPAGGSRVRATPAGFRLQRQLLKLVEGRVPQA